MNKYKYKYFMNGMIDGTDGKTYEIEVKWNNYFVDVYNNSN